MQDKIRIKTKLFIQIFKAYLNQLQYLGKKKAEKNTENNFFYGSLFKAPFFEIKIKRARVKKNMAEVYN